VAVFRFQRGHGCSRPEVLLLRRNDQLRRD